MVQIIKKITLPYKLTFWYLDFIIVSIRIISGFLLAFYYGPKNMGVPWDSETALETWQVSPSFLAIVDNFGGVFSKYVTFFAVAAALVEIIGGLLLIFGLATRVVSFLVFQIMLTTLIYGPLDNSWSYTPTIAFLANGVLGLWFGSGRIGLDYFICRLFGWCKE